MVLWREAGRGIGRVLCHDWGEDPGLGGEGQYFGVGRRVRGGFFIGGSWVVVLVAWSKVVAFRVLGSGRAQIVARLIVGVRGTVATGGVPR